MEIEEQHPAGRPGSSEVPRNPLTRWDVSSIPANGIFLTIKMPNGWRTIKSLVHKIRLHSRRGKGKERLNPSREKNLLLLIHTSNLNASKPFDQSKGLGGNIGCRLFLQLNKLWRHRSAIDLSNANSDHKEGRRSTGHIMVTTSTPGTVP